MEITSSIEPEASEPVPQQKGAAPSVFAVPLAIIIGAIMISGAIIYSRGPGGTPAAIGDQGTTTALEHVDMQALADNDPVQGDPDAPVTIVEFSDFQCPYCRSFYENTLSRIIDEYVATGKAKLVYRDFPLSFHPAARASALAAECANEQGKFWEFHDRMFQEQGKQGTGTITYGIDELKQWARSVGVDGARFDQCLETQKYAGEIDADMEDGQAIGVSGTPSFVINGQLIIGAQPFSVFKQAIDAAL